MLWKHLLALPVALSLALGGSGLLGGQTQNTYLASLPDKERLAHNISLVPSIRPDGLYHRVWRLIKEDYYEPSFTGQSWDRWEHRYDGKLKTLEDAHKAIETMLASLGDRYTRFLDRDAFDDEKSQIDAKLFGIGVQIGLDPDSHKVIVITPIEDTPAYKAGILASDEITEIDGKSTKGFNVEDAAKHIRGQINTPVNLVLTRSGKRVKVKVVRAEIAIKAIPTAKMLDSEVGYIRLSSFISQQANREMKEAIAKLSGAKGIVLDLRDNPGGLLTNAIDISNMFLDSGNILSTVDRDGYKTPAQSDGHPICMKPLALLINKGSASASEITSGALHDNNRAILVGQRTFGKGLVQGINRLEDGSGVNVTIAKYLTPSDTDIHKKGISPDVAIELSEQDLKDKKGPWWLEKPSAGVHRGPEDGKDVQLKAALEAVHKRIQDVDHLAVHVR
ncbi:S41 family peptidase [bacterium]|jgi:carboxyl-terminal processing protease|nr:S41 family peptidase [bacterium]